jgi:hypothetical protein
MKPVITCVTFADTKELLQCCSEIILPFISLNIHHIESVSNFNPLAYFDMFKMTACSVMLLHVESCHRIEVEIVNLLDNTQ